MTWGRRPGLLATLLALGTLGLAGALAWQAVQAAASHRAAVEANARVGLQAELGCAVAP